MPYKDFNKDLDSSWIYISSDYIQKIQNDMKALTKFKKHFPYLICNNGFHIFCKSYDVAQDYLNKSKLWRERNKKLVKIFNVNEKNLKLTSF